jgi:fatty-acyl-CoA synthase
MDEDGYLEVVDRKKDMVKTGGENVSSLEVEEAIYSNGKSGGGGGDRIAP